MKFYKESEKAELELIHQYPKAYLVFRFLARNMDDFNSVLVSQKSIAEHLTVSTKSIYRAVEFLKDNKYLKVTKSGRASIYHINSSIVGVKTDNNGCKFHCAVVLSKTELKLNTRSFYEVK